jgi:hypothetical protein
MEPEILPFLSFFNTQLYLPCKSNQLSGSWSITPILEAPRMLHFSATRGGHAPPRKTNAMVWFDAPAVLRIQCNSEKHVQKIEDYTINVLVSFSSSPITINTRISLFSTLRSIFFNVKKSNPILFRYYFAFISYLYNNTMKKMGVLMALSSNMLKDLLPEFQRFLQERKFTSERYIPFYALRVRQFLCPVFSHLDKIA